MGEMILTYLFAIIFGVFSFLSYRQGLKDGRQKDVPVAPLFTLPKKKAKIEPTDADEILDFIDKYEG